MDWSFWEHERFSLTDRLEVLHVNMWHDEEYRTEIGIVWNTSKYDEHGRHALQRAALMLKNKVNLPNSIDEIATELAGITLSYAGGYNTLALPKLKTN